MIMIFITVAIELLNEYYDRFLESRELKKALKNWACTCGRTGGMHRFGGYVRPYVANGQTEILWVQRIRCSYCGKTHALLPAHLVPYSRNPAEVQMQIILAMGQKEKQEQIMAVYPDLEERDFRRIRRDYHKSWESRISLEELKKRFASLAPRLGGRGDHPALPHKRRQAVYAASRRNFLFLYGANITFRDGRRKTA